MDERTAAALESFDTIVRLLDPRLRQTTRRNSIVREIARTAATNLRTPHLISVSDSTAAEQHSDES